MKWTEPARSALLALCSLHRGPGGGAAPRAGRSFRTDAPNGVCGTVRGMCASRARFSRWTYRTPAKSNQLLINQSLAPGPLHSMARSPSIVITQPTTHTPSPPSPPHQHARRPCTSSWPYTSQLSAGLCGDSSRLSCDPASRLLGSLLLGRIFLGFEYAARDYQLR